MYQLHGINAEGDTSTVSVGCVKDACRLAESQLALKCIIRLNSHMIM